MLWGRGADAPTARLRRFRRCRRCRSAPAGRRQSRCAKRRQPPSYRSYTSYWSYRVVLWHVADVPGVQGRVEVWKLGCLEVWLSRCTTIVWLSRCTTISPVARLSGVLFSVFCSRGRFGPLGLHAPFSRARRRPSPAGVWGSAPHLSNQLISQILCVPLWSFVFLAVEGLALWACTVIAAQREACPSLQASKLPSFHANRLRGKTSPESRQSGRGGDLLCYSLWIGLLRTRILGMRRCG